MKPCPVRVDHPAHSHPNIGYCPGIRKADMMARVERDRADAFKLATLLSRRIGVSVSPGMVRRNKVLWYAVWDKLTEVSNDVD